MKDDELMKNGSDAVEATEDTSAKEVKYEENDNWQFDGVAHTLSDDFLASVGVEDASQYETAKRPVKEEPKPQAVAVEKKTTAIKGDKLLFVMVAIIMAIIIAVLGVLGNSYYNKVNTDEKMNAGNVAMVVGDTKISLGMFNFYYTSISQQYIGYASYYGIDPAKDFSHQYTEDENGKKISWEDKFRQDAISEIKSVTAYYEEAVKHGVTLTKKQQEAIKANLDSLKDSATNSEDGKSQSVDKYISDMYGEGCGYATVKKMLTCSYIAQNYYQQKLIEDKVDEKEVNEYFKKHNDDYQNVSLAYLQIPYGDEYGVKEADAFNDGKKYAKSVKTVDDMKKLIPIACKTIIDVYVAQGAATDADSCAELLASRIEISLAKSEDGLMKEASEWLFDEKTKVGDCKAFDDKDNSVVYVLLKNSKPSPDKSKVFSVRHILITPQSDKQVAEGQQQTYTKAEWAEAKKKADKILAEYKKGEKTEVSFAALAEKYSDDTESTSAGSSGIYGGLTEGVALGNMVKEYENWSVDKKRKYGDVGIVKSQYGYHIMFFIENTDKYLFDCSKAAIAERENKYSEGLPVKEHQSVMKKVKPVEPQKEEDTQN